jgi:AcrR family transcriptional regulator
VLLGGVGSDLPLSHCHGRVRVPSGFFEGVVRRSEPVSDGDRAQRRYESPLRESRAADTRDRIIGAAAELARDLPSWDWGTLTIQAVADRAGVGRRTVYRHFASEADLHASLGKRLQEEAGVSYDRVTLDALPDVAERVFSSMAMFAVESWALVPSAFPTADAERLEGFRSAVAAATPDLEGAEREVAAAALDVVWSVASYELLLRDWHLQPSEAFQVQRWLHDLLVGAIRSGDKAAPGS